MLNRPAAVFVVLSAMSAAGAATALAKPPKPAENPTVEDIRKQVEDEIAKQAAQPPDPLKEAIAKYAARTSKLEEYAVVAACLFDAKAELERREEAVQALVARFQTEPVLTVPRIRAVRKEIALKVLDLMKIDTKVDENGPRLVESLLGGWYGHAKLVTDIKYRASDKQSVRAQAWKRMKSFLLEGDN